jgi:hypothetical protein
MSDRPTLLPASTSAQRLRAASTTSSKPSPLRSPTPTPRSKLPSTRAHLRDRHRPRGAAERAARGAAGQQVDVAPGEDERVGEAVAVDVTGGDDALAEAGLACGWGDGCGRGVESRAAAEVDVHRVGHPGGPRRCRAACPARGRRSRRRPGRPPRRVARRLRRARGLWARWVRRCAAPVRCGRRRRRTRPARPRMRLALSARSAWPSPSRSPAPRDGFGHGHALGLHRAAGSARAW